LGIFLRNMERTPERSPTTRLRGTGQSRAVFER